MTEFSSIPNPVCWLTWLPCASVASSRRSDATRSDPHRGDRVPDRPAPLRGRRRGEPDHRDFGGREEDRGCCPGRHHGGLRVRARRRQRSQGDSDSQAAAARTIRGGSEYVWEQRKPNERKRVLMIDYGVPRLLTGVSTAVLHHCGANGHFRVLPRCRCLPLWNIVYGIAGTNEDEWSSKVQMKQEIIPSDIYHESIFAIASHCQVKQQRYLLTIVHILMLAEFRQKSVRSARICRGLPSAKSPQQSPSQIFLTSTRQLSLQMYFFYEPHYDPLPKCDLTNSTRLAYTSPIQWRHEHFSC